MSDEEKAPWRKLASDASREYASKKRTLASSKPAAAKDKPGVTKTKKGAAKAKSTTTKTVGWYCRTRRRVEKANVYPCTNSRGGVTGRKKIQQ